MGRKNFITREARIQDFSQEIQTFFTIIPNPDSKPRLTYSIEQMYVRKMRLLSHCRTILARPYESCQAFSSKKHKKIVKNSFCGLCVDY